jgi:hypothetical protein
LFEVVEAFRFGRAVVESLPALLQRFLKMRTSYNVEWIMTPLWYALSTYLDDKLALACVSLERLASQHAEHSTSTSTAKAQPAFWSEEQGKRIRTAVTAALRTAAKDVELSQDKVEVLVKRVNQFGQMPNADRLTVLIEAMGVRLNEQEKRAIDNRNLCLHGRQTLKDAADIELLNQEIGRFDTLRMVIYKAMFTLFGYEGPYIDYAERPIHGEFPVKIMRGEAGGGP